MSSVKIIGAVLVSFFVLGCGDAPPKKKRAFGKSSSHASKKSRSSIFKKQRTYKDFDISAESLGAAIAGTWTLKSQRSTFGANSGRLPDAITVKQLEAKARAASGERDWQWPFLKGKSCYKRRLDRPQGKNEFDVKRKLTKKDAIKKAVLGSIVYLNGRHDHTVYQGPYDFKRQRYPMKIEVSTSGKFGLTHSAPKIKKRKTVFGFKKVRGKRRLGRVNSYTWENQSSHSFYWAVPTAEAEKYKAPGSKRFNEMKNVTVEVNYEIKGMGYHKDCRNPGLGAYYKTKLKRLTVKRSGKQIYTKPKKAKKTPKRPKSQIVFLAPSKTKTLDNGKTVPQGEYSFTYSDKDGKRHKGKGSYHFVALTRRIVLEANDGKSISGFPAQHMSFASRVVRKLERDRKIENRASDFIRAGSSIWNYTPK